MLELLGLFHPAIVHLPIGFIVMAIIANIIRSSHPLDRWLWGLAAFSSIVSVISGLMLGNSGHYEDFSFFLHKWTSITIAILTCIVFYTKWRKTDLPKNTLPVLYVVIIGLMMFAGHKGGELTHGKNYLPIGEPEFVVANIDPSSLDKQDTLLAYKHFIAPILEAKCTRCHEEGDARGRLNLTTVENLLSDKYGDPPVQPGDIYNSEIFKRIMLDPSDKKFMPPTGTPLTYQEIRLLEWWISDGASFDQNLRTAEISQEIKDLLLQAYDIDLKPKSFYEKYEIETLSQDISDNLKSNEFNVRQIAANNNYIDVSRIARSNNILDSELEVLLQAKEHVTWLDLSNTDLNDDHMSYIGQCPNITILKIQNTGISSDGLSQIKDLKNLTSLNIYGNQIDDSGVDHLLELNQLEKLYIWQTDISEEGRQRLIQGLPNTEIVAGMN